MIEPRVLTIAEAAQLLRVSEYTVGQMTRDGRLRRVPGLRLTRIPLSALVGLVEGYDAERGEPGCHDGCQRLVAHARLSVDWYRIPDSVLPLHDPPIRAWRGWLRVGHRALHGSVWLPGWLP